MLAGAFKRLGIPLILTREPGGTVLGEQIRRILLYFKGNVSPMAELLLYEASRAEHVASKVAPALRQGKLVICDRFTLATLAYQAAGRGLNLSLVDRLNHWAAFGIKPDLTVVLDLPVSVSLKRMGRKRDRMEQKAAFMKKVRRAYIELSRRRSDIFLVPADEPVDRLRETIEHLIKRHPKFRRFAKSRRLFQ